MAIDSVEIKKAVPKAYESLNLEVETLFSNLKHLEDIVKPICTSILIADEADEKRVSICDLSDGIYEVADKIKIINNRISYILNTIQI